MARTPSLTCGVPAAAATAFGTIALGAANVLKKGAYVTRTWNENSIKEKVFNRAMPLVHAAGAIGLEAAGALVAWGHRSDKTALAGPFSVAPWYPQARKLGLYFMTFSMLGHWVEMLFCTDIKHGIFKGGYDRENHMLWDYRDMRFHFMGRVCLQNSLFYSIIATWGVWQLLPALEKLMKKAGDTKLDGILVGMGSVFLFLELLYQAVPPKKKDAGNEEPDTTSDAGKVE